jgi:hypothetical protein
MKRILTLWALCGIALGQQPATLPQKRKAKTENVLCANLVLRENQVRPFYSGPGFSEVSSSEFAFEGKVPVGCERFSCRRRGDRWYVLACPDATVTGISIPAR